MATSSDGPIRSVLYDVQARQGGHFEDFHGWTWTLDLGDTAGEYEAIRTGAAMWDVYALVKWVVSGVDARRAIQRVFTNDLGSQVDGQVRYGAFVDDDGRLVDEGTVYRLSADRYFVFTNSDGFADHLTAHVPAGDFAVEQRTHQMPLISVQGPQSRERLQGLTATDLSSLRYFRFLPDRVEVAGVPVWLSRTGFSGELGFELVADRDGAEPLWLALAEAGVMPIGFSAVEIARVEAGLIIYDYDYAPGERTPFDVGLDRVVALDGDADFVGKAALTAVASNPPHRFRSLRLDTELVPEYGADVFLDGEVVGTLTSPTASPRFGTIGLAVLRSDVADPGTRLEVAMPDTTAPSADTADTPAAGTPTAGGADTSTVIATVAGPAVYDPDKRRPRT